MNGTHGFSAATPPSVQAFASPGFSVAQEGEVIDETAGGLFFPVLSPPYFHQCWDTLY